MKARKANVGGKWVAVQRGLLKRPSWWPFRRELLWVLRPYREGANANDGQTFRELLLEKS
jgi:hypothetical protein